MRDLSLILAWDIILSVHLSVETFLLRVVDDVVAELLVDLFPHLVLAETYHGSCLFGIGNHSSQAGDIILLNKLGIEFVQCKEVPFITGVQGHVVL